VALEPMIKAIAWRSAYQLWVSSKAQQGWILGDRNKLGESSINQVTADASHDA
jgi:hypothetical protein